MNKKQTRLDQENEILREDMKKIRIWGEVDKNQVRLEQENENLRGDMEKMKIKFEELEAKLRYIIK